MKNAIQIMIENLKSTLGLRHRSAQEEYTRLIEKFDVVRSIPVSVINTTGKLKSIFVANAI